MIDLNSLPLIGTGRHREVLMLPSNKHVIKIPLNKKGEKDNQYEYTTRSNQDYYAKCRLVPGTNFLIMEYLTRIDSIYDIIFRLGKIPEWVWTIDSLQVGFNATGKLLVFDYGFY